MNYRTTAALAATILLIAGCSSTAGSSSTPDPKSASELGISGPDLKAQYDKVAKENTALEKELEARVGMPNFLESDDTIALMQDYMKKIPEDIRGKMEATFAAALALPDTYSAEYDQNWDRMYELDQALLDGGMTDEEMNAALTEYAGASVAIDPGTNPDVVRAAFPGVVLD